MRRNELQLPDEALKYILFQRSYFRLPVTFFYRHLFSRLPFELPIYNLVVAVESRLSPERIKRLYRDDMAAEYRTLLPALPARCAALLDIGCGVAGIDVLLNQHYAEQAPDVYLLDKSQVERSVFYLFEPQAAFYNSLAVARELLAMNGIAGDRVHLLEASEANEIPVVEEVDLVLSLLSWGFHYPVDTYAARVWELLSDEGVVILDVRKGTDGLDVLRRTFRRLEVLVDAPKYQRVRVRK